MFCAFGGGMPVPFGSGVTGVDLGGEAAGVTGNGFEYAAGDNDIAVFVGVDAVGID